MIIKEIHIDGFGIFSNFSLTRFQKGINLLVGDNETGKSTLLKFIRFTLFGYPRSVDERMLPLRGGNHGGRIKTMLSSGKEVTFERMNSRNICLFYDNKESQNESEWIQLLGGATNSLFNNVYAITLDELSGLNSLTASGVEDKIFSVGLGLGAISIGEIEKYFKENAEKIYAKRGRKHRFSEILEEIKQKKTEIKEIQDNLPKYRQLTDEIEILETEVKTLTSQLKEWHTQKNKLDNYLKCYKSFIDYSDAVETLKTLPSLRDYPENGTERLGSLEEDETKTTDLINELKNGARDEKGIAELENEIAAIKFNQTLLDNDRQVEFLRSNLEKYKSTVKEKEEEERRKEKLNSLINRGIEDINSSWNEDTVKSFEDLLVHKNKLAGFKKSFETLGQEKSGLEAEIKAMRSRESAVNVKNIFSMIAVVFLVSSAPAFYYGYPVAGGAAVVAAFILFFGKKYFFKKTEDIPAQSQLNELLENETQLKSKYKNYLKNELNLSATLSPDAALEALKTVEDLKTKITERDEQLKKIQKDRLPFIGEFEEKTQTLAKAARIDHENEIEGLAKTVIRKHDESREMFNRKNHLTGELEKKTKKLQNVGKKLEEIRSEMENLISSIGADDAGDFRKKYADNEQVKQLLNTKDAAVRTIEIIAGIGKADEVIDYLNTVEKETIEDNLRETESGISELEEELSTKNKELGGKKNEKERLEGESELAGALTELETEIQRLNNAYREWLANKMALKILGMVKARYEQEKQPAVIRNSGKYFSKITKNRYPRIRVSLDERDVSVFDEKEAVKKINQLSRGTKEQLLISLRLGFIEEYEKQSEPLPIIVDEVLVNFDSVRAKKTAAILQEFGKERQILLFTCHPEIGEFFNNEINKISI